MPKRPFSSFHHSPFPFMDDENKKAPKEYSKSL
jgi:hypothetical protein